MSGFEWFFAVLSGFLMLASFWLRQREDRQLCVSKPRRSRPNHWVTIDYTR